MSPTFWYNEHTSSISQILIGLTVCAGIAMTSPASANDKVAEWAETHMPTITGYFAHYWDTRAPMAFCGQSDAGEQICTLNTQLTLARGAAKRYRKGRSTFPPEGLQILTDTAPNDDTYTMMVELTASITYLAKTMDEYASQIERAPSDEDWLETKATGRDVTLDRLRRDAAKLSLVRIFAETRIALAGGWELSETRPIDLGTYFATTARMALICHVLLQYVDSDVCDTAFGHITPDQLPDRVLEFLDISDEYASLRIEFADNLAAKLSEDPDFLLHAGYTAKDISEEISDLRVSSAQMTLLGKYTRRSLDEMPDMENWGTDPNDLGPFITFLDGQANEFFGLIP